MLPARADSAMLGSPPRGLQAQKPQKMPLYSQPLESKNTSDEFEGFIPGTFGYHPKMGCYPDLHNHLLGCTMKAFLAIGFIIVCVGCAHTHGPFVQNGVRIVPPVKQEGSDTDAQTVTLNIFNDGGTRWIKITDAEGNKFDVYVDHRIETKTPGAIYLFEYPGKSNSVRIVNQREFKQKLHFVE